MSGQANPMRVVAAALVLVASCRPLPAVAQEAGAGNAAPLVVGTAPEPPFAMKDADGTWSGIAIDLWREIARRQGLTYRLEEHDLPSLLAAVEGRRVDVAVGALLITAERERTVDFTSPFMHVALAIGTRSSTSWWRAIRSVFSGSPLWAGLGLAACMVVFALLIWLLERRRNPEHFGGGAMRGMGDAVWWSASTMTTVGYGDRTPVTFWGRTVGIVWMVASIFLVSALIAAVTSTLTVRQLHTEIRSLADLAHVRVGVVSTSGVAEYLHGAGIATVGFDTVAAAADAAVAGDVDAVVEEWPVLRYLARHRHPGLLAVIPQASVRGFTAFALPLDSPRRRALNVTLLEVLDDPIWREISRTYLGTSPAD
jgi:ABC-type amino acid transport substrate-binding protein